MNNNLIQDYIVDWFEQNSDVTKDKILSNLDENYLEKGWIDSFKFISFISDVEDHFNVRFENDEFQNRSFATINGLVKIIESKVN